MTILDAVSVRHQYSWIAQFVVRGIQIGMAVFALYWGVVNGVEGFLAGVFMVCIISSIRSAPAEPAAPTKPVAKTIRPIDKDEWAAMLDS